MRNIFTFVAVSHHAMSLPFQTPLDERTPLPVWLLPAYAGVFTGSLLLPTKFLRVAIGGPIALILLNKVSQHSINGFLFEYLLMIPLTGLLWQWMDFVIVNDPEEAFYKTDASQTQDEAKRTGSMPKDAVGKLMWGTALFTTVRGIGWNWKVKNVPAGIEGQSRGSVFP